MQPLGDGFHGLYVPDVGGGQRYRYRLDGAGPFPDPASRFQPEGVHGPSAVVDWHRFVWSDDAWQGLPLEATVFYEVHVGTFTSEGTFSAAAGRLPELASLGVTAVELMPVADFSGERNWGYDGVAPFAPARCYGTPDDLRRLVDTAHGLGLAVYLDVVYNHLGPDGAYQGVYSSRFYSDTHRSPWGAGVNFDGPGSPAVRGYVTHNALAWIHEYHVDGLRLDATHAIVDDSDVHVVRALAASVRASVESLGRSVHVIAEDSRNLACMVAPVSENGWGLDAVWADDFHHQMRRCLAGDRDGYFEDFTGTTEDIARTATQGWFYRGQMSRYADQARGSDPSGIPPSRFVVCLQNHDQIGNRAFGERLHQQIDPAAWRAASTLLLLLPETPLLFMGQEWAASAPFLYFTDHEPELGRLVTEGRRREFSRFEAFASPEARTRIPDPQDPSTFERSRLNWNERQREPHASVLRLYRRLLALRHDEPSLQPTPAASFRVVAADVHSLFVWRSNGVGDQLLGLVALSGADTVTVPEAFRTRGWRWTMALSTEEEAFAADAEPPIVSEDGSRATFSRPGAVVLVGPVEGRPGGGS